MKNEQVLESLRLESPVLLRDATLSCLTIHRGQQPGQSLYTGRHKSMRAGEVLDKKVNVAEIQE